MTFFESGGTDSSWPEADDPFARMREPRRRRAVRWIWAVVALCTIAFGAVLVIGPEKVATSSADLIGLGVPPPTEELLALADKSFLTEEGRALLLDSRPQLATLGEIAEVCQRSPDDPPAGCWAQGRGLYVYQPADARVADWAVTILAHELLHAAYDELDGTDLAALPGLLEPELARLPDDHPVRSSIEWSVDGHEGSRDTEMFAYLGSEIWLEGGFAPALEAIYARYFTDRRALVEVSGRVVGTLEALRGELEAAYGELTAAEIANVTERAQIEADRAAHEQAHHLQRRRRELQPAPRERARAVDGDVDESGRYDAYRTVGRCPRQPSRRAGGLPRPARRAPGGAGRCGGRRPHPPRRGGGAVRRPGRRDRVGHRPVGRVSAPRMDA